MAIRVTSTGQTTFVKKVVIGTPVRSVTGSGANFTSLSDVTITNVSGNQLINFDSASQKFVNTSNASIANLTVSGDIVPAADSASSLGSASKKFKNLFLSGNTIQLGTLRLKDSGGGLGVIDTAGAPKPIGLRGARQQIRSFFAAGGDLSYNPVTGIFSLDVEAAYTKANFDSDLGAALDGGTGITYDSSSDTISITNTGVTAATYGSASQVPQIAVNAQGQITSASNVSIAGVTGVTFDSSSGKLTVSTSAGSNFTDSINLSPFSTTNLSEGSNLYFTSGRADARVNAGFSAKSTTNLSEGNNLYYTTARADSAFDARFDSSFDERLATKSTSNLSEGSNLYFTTGRADARVNLQTGSNLDLSSKSTSNLSEGTNLYFTTARADSDAKNAISGGTGIGYNSTTGVITSNDGQIVHDNLSGFVADEHVAHSGVSIVAGKGLSGGGTIASSRTIDIDSANVRGMFSGSNGISYTSGTGDIRAPQPLDSAANPTFNQLRGPATFIIDPATIGDATGTLRVLGNLTVDGTTTTINSTNVSVNDKTFTIADSAADSSGLAGAGIIWGGSSITANKPSFKYNHASERFDANRTINATSFIGSVTGNVSGTAASVTNAAQTNITSLGTLTGLTSTGDVAVDSAGGFLFDVSDKALEFGDNYKASFGAGSDLQIFHDGTNSRIYGTTGDTLIGQNTFGAVKLTSNNDAENMLVATVNGAVELYYDNSKKIETRDSGVTITGELNVDSATLTNLNYQLISQGVANNSYDKIRLWSSAPYALGMVQANTFGGLDDYAITFTMSNNDNRGFLFRDNAHSTAQGAMAITTDGELTVAKAARIGYGISDTTSPFDSNGAFALDIFGSLKVDSAVVQDKLFLDSEGNTSRMNLEQVNSFSGDILRIKTADGTVDIGPANSSYSHFVTDRNKFFFNRKVVVDDILSSYNGNLELQKAEVTKLTLSDSGATVTGQLVADSATFTNATITNISNAPIFKAVGGNEGGEINLEKAPNSTLDDGTYNKTVIDMNLNKLRFFTNGSARGAFLNLSNMDSNSVGSNEIVTEKTSHTFTKSQTFSNDVAIDSAGGFFFDVSDKALEFGDNYKASFGAGGDLKIFHDGTKSKIADTSGTGPIVIASNELQIRNAADGEDLAKFTQDGSVELYYNNVKKLETRDSGGKVTGDLVVTDNIQLQGSTYTNFNDFWGSNDNAAFFTPYGYLGSNGSFAVSLFSNGYRNQSGGFTSMGINSNSTASGIELFPTGEIKFRTGTPSGTTVPQRMAVTNSGLSVTGTASATTFSGSGSDLTNLPAGQLTGTIDSARLPTGTFGGGGGSSLSNIADSSGGVVITGDIKEKSTDSGAGLLLLQTNNTILSSGDSVGAIHFQAPDEASGGVAANVTGKIENLVSGTMSSTKATTDFSFSLPNGSTALREVVRFQADGDIQMQGSQILMQTGSYYAIIARSSLSGSRIYTLPDATGTIITTGNSNTPASTTSASDVDFVLVDDGGTMKRISRSNLGISVTSSLTTNSTSQTAIYTASKTTYGAAKLLVTAVSSSERHITEIYLTHDGTTAVATEYGTVTTNGILATYDVDISGSNFRLLATAASSASTTFKVKPTLIEA